MILIFVGCVCHLMHLAARRAAKCLPVDVENPLIDIFYYLDKSSKRKQALIEVQERLKLPVQKIIKHVPTRWLSLGKCLDRLVGQYDALVTYFKEEVAREEKQNKGEKRKASKEPEQNKGEKQKASKEHEQNKGEKQKASKEPEQKKGEKQKVSKEPEQKKGEKRKASKEPESTTSKKKQRTDTCKQDSINIAPKSKEQKDFNFSDVVFKKSLMTQDYKKKKKRKQEFTCVSGF